MATPEETTWDIEPHTAVKHKILQNYLSAWFPILNRYHRRVIYLDGFSGPGIYKGGEPGSPIIALRTANEHFRPIDGEAVFLFVEDRADRVANLRLEVSKLTLPQNYKVHIESGHFEAIVSKILDDLEKDGKSLAQVRQLENIFDGAVVFRNCIARFRSTRRCSASLTLLRRCVLMSYIAHHVSTPQVST